MGGDVMTEQADGGPAFARPATEHSLGGHYEQDGMSLLDYMAAAALPQAVLDYGEPSACSSSGQRRDRGNPVLPYAATGSGTREEIIARQAYKYAYAMIAARTQWQET